MRAAESTCSAAMKIQALIGTGYLPRNHRTCCGQAFGSRFFAEDQAGELSVAAHDEDAYRLAVTSQGNAWIRVL